MLLQEEGIKRKKEEKSCGETKQKPIREGKHISHRLRVKTQRCMTTSLNMDDEVILFKGGAERKAMIILMQFHFHSDNLRAEAVSCLSVSSKNNK